VHYVSVPCGLLRLETSGKAEHLKHSCLRPPSAKAANTHCTNCTNKTAELLGTAVRYDSLTSCKEQQVML
jgi:hypothetical protein